MAMKDKVCVTTFVYGYNYQIYIPIAVWSLAKMYPEYDIVIFLHGVLNEKLKSVLLKLGLLDKVKFHEFTFADCPRMTTRRAICLRWVLWDKCFTDYDYIYTMDIDMFYIKEPLPLHEQHALHMKKTGLPFDNMRRIIDKRKWPLKAKILDIGVFVKNAGFSYKGLRYLLPYIMERTSLRLTGLHFVDVKKYYGVYTEEKIEYNKSMIYDGSFLKYSYQDEAFLYCIMKELGFDVDILAVRDLNEPYKHLNFNNYNKDLFRPIHGIHMGDYRGNNFSFDKYESYYKTSTSIYYKSYIQEKLLNDEDFIMFLKAIPEEVSIYFKRYFISQGLQWPI